jgi:zinc transporter 9
MDSHSTRTVIVGITANTIITAGKFVAFALSGSGAMLSEAIHSVADTGNQSLLLLGLRRSLRPEDERHPEGYGRARFFWGLVSALGIFFLGAGVTIYHGIHGLIVQEAPHVTWVTWTVLAVSLVIEGGAGVVALRGVFAAARKAKVSLLRYLREGRDPTTIAVLLEDGVAVLGIVLAGVGIGLTEWTGWAGWDALASITIGVLLAFVAIFLVAKNQSFLLDRAVDREVITAVRSALTSDQAVEGLHRVRGIVVSIDRLRISAHVDFNGAVLADRVLEGRDLDALAAELKDGAALRAWAGTFGEEVVTRLASEIEAAEGRVTDAVPEARDVLIEAH